TGAVYCWGHNADGQLGAGPRIAARPQAGKVTGVSGVVQIVAGMAHTCALRGDGKVLCWGSNHHGQLGTGAEGPTVSGPVEVVGLDAVTSLAAEQHQTCAIHGGGLVSCWGRDFAAKRDVGRPTRVEALRDVVEIALGTSFGCARDA